MGPATWDRSSGRLGWRVGASWLCHCLSATLAGLSPRDPAFPEWRVALGFLLGSASAGSVPGQQRWSPTSLSPRRQAALAAHRDPSVNFTKDPCPSRTLVSEGEAQAPTLFLKAPREIPMCSQDCVPLRAGTAVSLLLFLSSGGRAEGCEPQGCCFSNVFLPSCSWYWGDVPPFFLVFYPKT